MNQALANLYYQPDLLRGARPHGEPRFEADAPPRVAVAESKTLRRTMFPVAGMVPARCGSHAGSRSLPGAAPLPSPVGVCRTWPIFALSMFPRKASSFRALFSLSSGTSSPSRANQASRWAPRSRWLRPVRKLDSSHRSPGEQRAGGSGRSGRIPEFARPGGSHAAIHPGSRRGPPAPPPPRACEPARAKHTYRFPGRGHRSQCARDR